MATGRRAFEGKSQVSLIAVLTAVEIHDATGGEFKAGAPQPLFSGLQGAPRNSYDVAPGGRRFLILATESRIANDGRPSPVVVVVNWKSGLKQ